MGHSHETAHNKEGFTPARAGILCLMIISFGLIIEFINQYVDVFGTLTINRTDTWMIVAFGVLFVALWGVLEHSFFGPYMKLIDVREEATSGAVHEAQEKMAKADVIFKEYEEKIIQTRVREVHKKLTALAAAKAEAEQIVKNGEEEAKKIVKTSRENIEAKIVALRGNVARDVDSMADVIVTKLKQPFTLVMTLVFALIPALASATDHAAGHTPHFSETIPFWINFFIYFVLIVYFLKKPFKQAWSARREQISSDLKRASEASEVADEKLQQAMQKIAALDLEQKTVEREISEETEHETQQIIADARARAARLIEQAKITSAAEERVAEAAIRREVSNLVLKRVRERLEKELDVRSDKQLRDAALGGVKELVSGRL